MSNKTKAIIAILLSAVLGGAVGTVVKFAIRDIPPFSFSFVRFLIASICLLPFFLKARIKIDKNLIKLAVFSLLPTANIGFFVLGVKTTTASIAQIIYAGVPILVGILGYFLLGHKMSLKRWFYITLGFAGVLVIIFLPVIQKNTAFSGDLQGNLFIFIAVVSWAIYATFSKKLQNRYSPIVVTSVFCFVSTFCFLLLSLPEITDQTAWLSNLKMHSVLAVLYVSIFGTSMVYLLNQYAFKYANPVIGSFNLYLLPFFAYVSAFFILGERLTAGLIFGTMLVFISIALTTYSK